MRKPWTLVAAMAAAVAVSDCNCSDLLGSATGAIGLELCDRGAACGCTVLNANSTIDFGAPDVGNFNRRIVTILNDNQPRKLTVERFEIDDPSGVFGVVNVQKRASSADDAEVTSHDMASGPLVLEGEEEGVLVLAFQPTAAGSASATLTVVSNSATRPRWALNLSGGAGNSDVCVPSLMCGDGSSIDFGTFNDSEVGFDPAANLPLALGTESISIENSGQSDLFVTVELTDDGIPETRPDELVGEAGVFFLGAVGCAVIPPGETLLVPVEYRPSFAGEHRGEVTIGGAGAPIRVELFGRVIGAHICFRTEDDVPQDNVLQFGDAPTYESPQNDSETRRLWAGNCGYMEDLTISDAVFTPSSSGDFATMEIPWTMTTPLAPGQEVEIPVTLTPSGAVGSSPGAGIQFSSNDGLRPTAIALLRANIGQPRRCILAAVPNPVDFGWVATDEESQGTMCPPPPFPCTGGGEMVSRKKTLVLSNAGQLACDQITFGSLIPDAGDAGMFQITSNPNPASFSLNPGEVSQPIEVLFAKNLDTNEPAETPHRAKLPYMSPDMVISPIEILLVAKTGGFPTCRLTYQPVSPPSFFCPDESLAFGNVNIGTSKTIDLKVTNGGGDGCTLTQISLANNSGVFTIAPPALPLPLAPQEFTIMPVTFLPVPSSGDPFEELPFGCFGGGIPGFPIGGGDSIVFNYVSDLTPSTPESDELALSGKGTRPDIDVIPGELDFGDVTVGCCSATQRVAIYNSGDGTLTINAVGVSASSDAGYSITQPADLVLDPGEQTEFTARWCASSEGASAGLIEIESTDDNEEFFTVPMTGNGVLDNTGDDVFQQPLKPRVDVLFAVDDSGSMGDEQQNLANNFGAFIQQAISLDTEYHIGVVTTDSESDQAGKLYACQDPPRYITWEQPAATQDSQFRCNVKTSDSGRPSSDSKESALQAARLALDYPLIDGFNTGFYREEAKLYLILVTDEEDQSDGTAQLYVDYFRNLKGLGNPDLLNISAIAGPPPDGCATAAANQKDYDAVQMVGGQFRSICAADWSNLIASLGLDVFNARRQFPLSRPATAATIMVEVCQDDGMGNPNPATCMTIPQDATNGWTFDGAVNAVTTHGTGIPGPGEHIQIVYEAVCY